MANTLEYIISLKDKFTAVAEKVNVVVNKVGESTEKVLDATSNITGHAAAFRKLREAARNAIKGPDTLKYSIDELKEKLDEINKVRLGTVLKSEFDKATKEAKKLEEQIRRLEQGVSGGGFRSKMKGWRQDFANSLPGANLIKNPLTLAGVTIGGFWKATQAAMDAGKEKMKMQVLTGSSEIGATLYDGLTKFATDTVFGNEVYDMGAQMLANGIKDSDVMPIMQELGDISMGDAQKLGSLSLAFAQINGKGKLAGQELLQLINAGFNPLQVISEKTGESMESLQKRMEKGKIEVSEVRKAMQIATGEGGKFNKMLEKVANTPYGQLEGLRGQLEQMMVKIGEVFLPIATKLMSFISWLGEKAGPILQPLALIIGVVSASLIALAAAQWLVNLAMWSNPITWIIAAIAALIAIIAYCIYGISGWGKAWEHTVEGAKYLWEGFVATFEAHWNTMLNGFMIGLNKIKEGWYSFKNAVGLGDKAENNAMLQQISEDTENREKSIREGYAKVVEAGLKAKNSFSKAWGSLEFKGVSDIASGIAPVGGVPGTALTDNNGTGVQAEGSKTNEAIATGGTKHNYITINLNSLIEVFNNYAKDISGGAEKASEETADGLLRVLAMAATAGS